MNSYKVNFANGDNFITGFNGTIEDARNYYVDKYFNFGIDGDIMVKAISVEEV